MTVVSKLKLSAHKRTMLQMCFCVNKVLNKSGASAVQKGRYNKRALRAWLYVLKINNARILACTDKWHLSKVIR